MHAGCDRQEHVQVFYRSGIHRRIYLPRRDPKRRRRARADRGLVEVRLCITSPETGLVGLRDASTCPTQYAPAALDQKSPLRRNSGHNGNDLCIGWEATNWLFGANDVLGAPAPGRVYRARDCWGALYTAADQPVLHHPGV
jgi:hypothetical protein